MTITPTQSYINAVLRFKLGETIFDLESILTPDDQEQTERLAVETLKTLHRAFPRTDTLRYQFSPLTKREELLNLAFELVYANKPDRIISIAERIDPQQAPFYPTWEKIPKIYIPKTVAAILTSIPMKIIFAIITAYTVSSIGNKSYHFTTQFIQNSRINSWIQNSRIHSSIQQMIKDGGIKWIQHRFSQIQSVVWKVWFVSFILNLAGFRIFSWIHARVNSAYNIIFFKPQNAADFISGIVFETLFVGWRVSKAIGQLFKTLSEDNDTKRKVICRVKAKQVWKTIIQNHATKKVL